MILITHIKTGQKSNSITKITPSDWQISVKAQPKKNQANLALQKIIAKHLSRPTNHVSLKRGHTSKTKIWEIAP